MKAFMINKPGEHSIAHNVEKPTITEDEVLVRVRRVGFCGSDLNTFRGTNPIVQYPRIPGHEIAAEVVERGANVPEKFRTGDKVLILPYTTCGECWSCLNNRPNACKSNKTLGVQQDGGMTEYLAVRHEKLIGGINHMSLDEIALVEPLAVGFHAAYRGEPKKGETLLVFGCGLVGLGAIAGGSQAGAKVIAVDIDDGKLELARKFGASHGINSMTRNLEEEVMKLTDGHGASVTVEAIGLGQTFVSAVNLAAFSGRVVYVGYVKDAVAFDTKHFIMKEIQIRGSRNALKSDFENVLKFMSSEQPPLDELISMEVPLEEAGAALQQWADNPGAITKILVSFDEDGKEG